MGQTTKPTTMLELLGHDHSVRFFVESRHDYSLDASQKPGHYLQEACLEISIRDSKFR